MAFPVLQELFIIVARLTATGLKQIH